MNFYNPYIYSMPANTASSIFSKLSLSSIVNGTSKTLNLVNQTIPIIKQLNPIIKNAKTMFSVINEFGKTNKQNEKSNIQKIENIESNQNNIQSTNPQFFL